MGHLYPVRQKYDLDMPFIWRLNMYVDVYECQLDKRWTVKVNFVFTSLDTAVKIFFKCD